jgi:hypothetical protein
MDNFAFRIISPNLNTILQQQIQLALLSKGNMIEPTGKGDVQMILDESIAKTRRTPVELTIMSFNEQILVFFVFVLLSGRCLLFSTIFVPQFSQFLPFQNLKTTPMQSYFSPNCPHSSNRFSKLALRIGLICITA